MHTIAYRWRSLPRARRHSRTSSPQDSSRNGCSLYRSHRGPNNVRLSFSTPTRLLVCMLYGQHLLYCSRIWIIQVWSAPILLMVSCTGKYIFSPICTRSRLRIWSRETTSSIVQPGVSVLILQRHAEYGAY